MVLRRRAFGNRRLSAVVGMPVVLGTHRWNRSFEG